MHRTTRAVLALITVSVGLSYLSQRPTQAYPRFKTKEGLTSCGYCHVAEAGKGARNYRGNFYEEHANSFAGFDDAAEAKKAGVDIAPHADEKPASLTAPAAAPAATPVPEKPAATPAPKMATKMATPAPKMTLAEASAHEKMAKAAYMKSKTATTKATFVAAIKKTLAMDPKNATAKADMKAVGAK